VAAEPDDERTVNHLDWTVFCRAFYVFIDFTRAGGSYAPSGRSLVIAGDYKSPSWEQALPGGYFDRDTIFHAFEGMMNSPVELGIVGLGRWTGPMSIGRMVVGAVWGVIWTLNQRANPRLTRERVVLTGEA
jgi:hypothetical protein